MLHHLAIKDLAVIDNAALDFSEGLNVLTGETGAGKSIVVGALSLVLGDRARSSLIRKGCDNAEVQALFRIPIEHEIAARLSCLDLLGEIEGNGPEVELLIRRIIARNGRGRAYVNGVLVTVATLAEITKGLVDISSQHEHTHLLDEATHLRLLDRYASLENKRSEYQRLWAELSDKRTHWRVLQEAQRDRLQKEDFLRFQLDELERLSLQENEDQRLGRERQILLHAERLLVGLHATVQLLSGDGGCAQETVRNTSRTLETLAEVDGALSAFAQRLAASAIELEDIAFELSQYVDKVEVDPQRLEEVEIRLDAMNRLQRKHGLGLDGLIHRAEELKAELSGFESLEEELNEAENVVAQLEERARDMAKHLSEARHIAAKNFDKEVSRELRDLAMDGATIRANLSPLEAIGPEGLEHAAFQIETNVGGGFGSLKAIASGGELSRLLLALKSAFNLADEVLTGVFDEVDSGVGGAIAEVIGLKLVEISTGRQMVTITHLPQIAALASHHLRVEKHVLKGKTSTVMRVLDSEQRREEIARMLGGVEITETIREHADELLERTQTGALSL